MPQALGEPSSGLSALPLSPDTGLLIVAPHLHFLVKSILRKLILKDFKGLLNIVVVYLDFQKSPPQGIRLRDFLRMFSPRRYCHRPSHIDCAFKKDPNPGKPSPIGAHTYLLDILCSDLSPGGFRSDD